MTEQNFKKNMIWNAAGNIVYLLCQWLLTVLVFRMSGEADAGVLSVAMSVSATFQTVALFGIRNFQVSDISGKYTDTCYVGFRLITCAVALGACMIFSLVTAYRGAQLLAIFLFMLFRLAENFSDVLVGIAQKNGRLDIAGKSFAIKGVGTLACFVIFFKISGSLNIGLLSIAVFSCLSTLLYDTVFTKKLATFSFLPKDRSWLSLGRETAPLCIYLFLNSALSTIPKLILEKQCGNEILGFYSSVFAPALLVAAAANYLYNPFVPMLATARDNRDKRAFFSIILKLMLIMAVIAVLILVAAAFLGEWALTLVFGARIAPHSYLLIPILISIFTCVICSFLSTVAVVLRDFAPILVACGAGVLAEACLTAPLIEWCGTNGTSYSFILGSLVAAVILTVRLLFITRHGMPSQPTTKGD